MKKNGVIVFILLVIILLHGAVLYFCFRPSSSEKKEVRKEQSETKPSAVPETPQKNEAKVSPVPSITPAEYQSRRKKISRAGQPLNYQYAVNGNIAAIPLSAEIPVGILVDVTTRNVLWCKRPRDARRIASMTKVMTILLAYEEVQKGTVQMNTPIRVTKAAYSIGGSQVHLDPRETFSLSELIKAASIQSANDAAYLIAEYLGGGDVPTFVRRMNQRAQELNMTKTVFHNPHGLPERNSALDNVSSPEDMVYLAEQVMTYPLLMDWASTLAAPFRPPNTKGWINMHNHNHLLPGASHAFQGVNGLKTGFTKLAGFCVTVTCDRAGHQLVGVVMGVKVRQTRDEFMRQVLSWGYARVDDPAKALQADARIKVAPAPVKKASAVRRKNTRKRR